MGPEPTPVLREEREEGERLAYFLEQPQLAWLGKLTHKSLERQAEERVSQMLPWQLYL